MSQMLSRTGEEGRDLFMVVVHKAESFGLKIGELK